MFTVICSEIAAILIFFYAIHRFSKIIARCNIHALKSFFAKITNNPIKSMLVGAGAAGLMQSNKAVSSIALTLVNAGAITAISSLPILFGTPIGSASTAFLVSMKLENLEEILIIIGAIIKKTKYKNIGHIIFYLGLLLFSLELMSKATFSLREEQWFRNIFLLSNNIVVLFLMGLTMSFVLQSGALTVSIITILVNYSVLPLYNSIAIGIGVTVGSTLSLIIVSYSMNAEAKKACYIHLIIVAIFGILALPFTNVFAIIGSNFHGGMGFAVGNFASRIFISIFGYLTLYIILKFRIHENSKIKAFIIKKAKTHMENFETNIKL